MADQDSLLQEALEVLRLKHLAFRRAEPEEMRELEEMRLNVLEAETTGIDKGHLAHLRLRLTERAYYVLRLNDFANAPENQGWMGLFRTWAREDPGQVHYEARKLTFAADFRGFYETYICGCSEAEIARPIHHPWFKRKTDKGAGLFMDTGRTEPPVYGTSVRPGAGGEIDGSGSAGVDKPTEVPSGENQSGDAGTAPNK